jgi:hypothetical protein
MSDEPAIDLSIYNALHRIFALQDRRHLPWCLFLTTRIGVDGFSSEVLQALADKIKANVDTCPPFSDALLEHGVQLLSAAELLDPSDGQEFFRTAIVGLVKWLLGLARLVRSRFSVGSVVSYRVQAGALSADMASLVMRFVPVVTIPADPMHIATTSYPVSNECEQAARIPKKVAEMNDLDGLFAENFDLWENFRDSSADLLHQARYDKAAYIAWADEQRGRYQGDSSATSDDAQSVEQK